MKKAIIVFVLLFLVTGCQQAKDLSFDEALNTFEKANSRQNIYRTGYKYYLPRNMQITDSTLYNEVIEDKLHKYYLYVDAVSYYDKKDFTFSKNESAVYSNDFSYLDKRGYLEINLIENNQYLVEIMYNYAKIEVIVDDVKATEVVLSAINILKSIEYNDNIIANLLGDDILNFKEEEFSIFEIKGKEEETITKDDTYEHEEEDVLDTDLVN